MMIEINSRITKTSPRTYRLAAARASRATPASVAVLIDVPGPIDQHRDAGVGRGVDRLDLERRLMEGVAGGVGRQPSAPVEDPDPERCHAQDRAARAAWGFRRPEDD